MNFISVQKALDLMKRLSEEEKLYVINRLVATEDMSLLTVIYAETKRLELYRQRSREDIRKLAEAGLYLGNKQIKKIPSIKEKRERQLQAALTRTLLATGIRNGTKSSKEIDANIDFSEINEEWYRECWALESVKEVNDPHQS